MGIKLIYAIPRSRSQTELQESIHQYKQLVSIYPNFIIGFDLVGQEDTFNPLINKLEELRELTNNTTFFFHAGETNWFGTGSDRNLIDAVLLKAKRIGHG